MPTELGQRDGWFKRHRRRIAVIGTGHVAYGVFNFVLDQIVYVYVVYRLGLLVGGGIMTAFSMLQCAITLVLYERMRIDWVGAGSVARLAHVPDPAWWQRVLRWASGQPKFVIFVALCVLQDPFVTTAYFRQGRFDGLKGRDWQVFFGSVFVSNLYWTLRSGLLIVVLRAVWRWVSA